MTVLEDTGLNVVDDRMAVMAIQLVSLDEASGEQKRRAMEFAEAVSVSFSYKNLARVDYLAPFRDLTKLQLDNNNLTKIEGLDHLTHLKWLDLSFNKLAKIEGLTSLTKLEDLSLYHNAIVTIEGLEGCVDTLVSLSLGENQITDLSSFEPLRALAKLRLANFVGNPVCDEEDYAPFLLSRTCDLRYLDHRIVRQHMVDKAKDQYADDLSEIANKEEEIKQTKRKAASKKSKDETASAQNVRGVAELFDDMTFLDPEFEKLRKLPHEKDGGTLVKGLPVFREATERLVEEFTKQMEKQRGRKAEETREWRGVLDGALRERNEKARGLVKKLDTTVKHAFRALELNDPNHGNEILGNEQHIGAHPVNVRLENALHAKRIKQVLREAKTAARSERRRETKNESARDDSDARGFVFSGVNDASKTRVGHDVEESDASDEDGDTEFDSDSDTTHDDESDVSHPGSPGAHGNGSDGSDSEVDVYESVGRWLRLRNDSTKEKLLAIEMHCADFTSDLIFEYDRSYSDICDKSRALITTLFTEMRALEDAYFAEMAEASTKMLELFSTGRLDDVCDEDAAVILGDKDTFMNAVRAHHDFHVNAIDQKEDLLVTEERRRLEATMRDLNVWERERNRGRVGEITGLWERTKLSIDEFCGEEESDDDEEEENRL